MEEQDNPHLLKGKNILLGKRNSSTKATKSKNEPKKNTAIFITGLPEDTNLPELHEYFSKYGLIMDDMFTAGPRIKMYENPDGEFKGEALVVYLREESAEMAVQFLDESYFRQDVLIRVQKASFDVLDSSNKEQEEKEEQQKKKPAVDKKKWIEHMQSMSKKLAWTANDYMSPEEEAEQIAEHRRREKYKRIVILRQMFTAKDLEDPTFTIDLKTDLTEECERFGEVTSIHVLSETEACAIKFREKEAAAACLLVMQGRFFAGRRIIATLYDGSISLKEQKSVGDNEERLEKYGEWLEQQDQIQPPEDNNPDE